MRRSEALGENPAGGLELANEVVWNVSKKALSHRAAFRGKYAIAWQCPQYDEPSCAGAPQKRVAGSSFAPSGKRHIPCARSMKATPGCGGSNENAVFRRLMTAAPPSLPISGTKITRWLETGLLADADATRRWEADAGALKSLPDRVYGSRLCRQWAGLGL